MAYTGLVEHNENWINLIKSGNATDSQRMFTSESYYQAFWENADHGILLIDEDGNIIDANTAFLDLVHSDIVDVTSKSIRELLPYLQYRKDAQVLRSIVLGKRGTFSKEEEINYEFNEHQQIPVRLVVTRIPSELGQTFKHVVVHVYDLRDPHFGFDQPNSNPDTVYKELTWSDVGKKLIVEHFSAFCAIIGLLLLLAALTGNFGNLVEKTLEGAIPDQQEQIIK